MSTAPVVKQKVMEKMEHALEHLKRDLAGLRTVSGASARDARNAAASAHPAARTAADVGGPATSTSSTVMPGPAAADSTSAIPAVRATWITPVPSARNPAAIGGRFGPRRTTSSRA